MYRSLLLAACPLFLTDCDPGCENVISQDLQSPDGRHRVVVFSRNCGATSGYNNQATILRKDDPLPNEEGNVFVIDKDDAKVSWAPNGKLFVSFGPDARFYKKESLVEGVAIEYRS